MKHLALTLAILYTAYLIHGGYVLLNTALHVVGQ